MDRTISEPHGIIPPQPAAEPQQEPGVKQVVAIVKPFIAEKVLDALKLTPIEALHVREVKGFGRQKSYLDQYSETEFALAFLPKVEITFWVDDASVKDTLERISQAARTGRMGDGKIFVMPLVKTGAEIDIATGERR
jgi:nitrogen regulatory protein P-II 1